MQSGRWILLMAKLTDLPKTLGRSTKSDDLFLIVDVSQGDDGSRALTRAELAEALREEQLGIVSDQIDIDGGDIANVNIRYDNTLPTELQENDYFHVTDISLDRTYRFSFGDLQDSFSKIMNKAKKVYVSEDGDDGSGNGSFLQPYETLEKAFQVVQDSGLHSSISVLPGTYYTQGNLELPDNCSIVSTNGQYSTKIVMEDGYEETNCILIGSGCYVQGFSFDNMRVDDFDDPTVGFAVAFRPGAKIIRSPYVRDISQISNYNSYSVAAPLDPVNGNPLVGNGGGVILADRAVLDQNSVFTYMLAFAATPRSTNGIGYCAKNGAGINGISSISIFQRCAFYALNGGQITLNNSGTQFGDISMRANGSTPVVDPHETTATLVTSTNVYNIIETNKQTIIDNMWIDLVNLGYTVDETKTRRDAEYWLTSVAYDFRAGQQTTTRNFVAGLFDYKGDHIIDFNNVTLRNSFTDAWDILTASIKTYGLSTQEEDMLDGLLDVTKTTFLTPTILNFGSLIESLGHQFNLAGAGVNKNALPLNFRKVGQSLSAATSVLQENSGRVRWSGADERNNQYFAKGLRVNGRTGRLEGKPFTSAVRKIARRTANSRAY